LNILKLLVENQENEYSIRQISKLRKINYKSAYENVKKLGKEGIISIKERGNISLCSFNRKFNDSVYIVEHSRLEEFLKNKNFRVMHDRLDNIDDQFILLLFGSHVKKRQTKHSDIDLLLISKDPKNVRNELELLPLNTHLTHVTYEEFISMLKSSNPTVVLETIKKNIIFFGIEDYYRLIKNAR
ncbi:MAG: nucleotidyltransferase domain-containing protein, partial [Candidatus Aenigmarchaeota archaeon]|nr:nucleotidyltransferase domain-containing protein [Candidatus Aenigmarchaeota archaeon]